MLIKLKYFILSALCKLNDFRLPYIVIKQIYHFFVYALTYYFRRVPGVEFIYLRRGVAKAEFIPFLSDIDMTIIVKTSDNIKDIQSRLQKLQKVFPILEPESQVIEKEELLSLLNEENFAKNRPILYRILEAKFTWKLLYSKQSFNLLDKIDIPENKKIPTLILSEALYWHGIVVSEYTSYRLNRKKKISYYQAKTLCWIFMKATCEFTNLFHGLLNHESLVFNRRKIIQQAKKELVNTKWVNLFEKNELILNNQFDIREIEAYLNDAFAYHSFLYKNIFWVLSSKLENDWEMIEWYRKHCHTRITGKPLKIHPINLNKISIKTLLMENSLSALFVTPQPINNSRQKVLVIFVLDSLDPVPNEIVSTLFDEIRAQLKLQDVESQEIELNIVDHLGFLCFSAPRQFGMKTKCLAQKNAAYQPSLYSMIFDDSISYDQSQRIISNYFRERQFS